MEDTTLKLIHNLTRLVHRRIEKELSQRFSLNAKEALTPKQAMIIKYLHKNPQKNIFQRDIETEFEIRRSTVSVLLKNMEPQGLIKRELCDEDARVKRVVLTKKAEDLNEYSENILSSINEILLDGIEKSKIDIFNEVMEKMYINIEKREGIWE